MKIADCYFEFIDEFIQILFDFESMYDGHLGSIFITEHCIELFPADEKSTHSTSYAGRKHEN